MDTIKKNVEEIAVIVISGFRRLFMPFFDKYSGFYQYINYIFYFTYGIVLFGIYHTTPESIPLLRNTILYIAVIILILRFNQLSWNNPKFAILGGNKFSEFDRKLIFSLCTFILFSHIVSEAVANYAKEHINRTITQPVSKTLIQPIYQYIDTSGAVDKIPALKNIVQGKNRDGGSGGGGDGDGAGSGADDRGSSSEMTFPGEMIPMLAPTNEIQTGPTVMSQPVESFSSTFSLFETSSPSYPNVA